MRSPTNPKLSLIIHACGFLQICINFISEEEAMQLGSTKEEGRKQKHEFNSISWKMEIIKGRVDECSRKPF
ncbi:hypothetical protein LWI29_033044 [Acer saccharum]|uniref:Uncharacterized protein n=1 Tax=Acer saccharum TaxID=4024 RepID=A0AA39VZ09_ACESA|nr:hypothetical protein LWI29_033044 [Acer saccharum]